MISLIMNAVASRFNKVHVVIAMQGWRRHINMKVGKSDGPHALRFLVWRSVVMSIVFNINDQIFGVTLPHGGDRPKFGLLRHTLMKIPR